MFSRTAGYGISAIVFLAAQPEGKLCAVRTIAQQQCIPRSFLSRILYWLCRGGLVRAVRGTGGGYCLAVPPNRIPLVSILEALGEKPERSRCVLGFNNCTEEAPCSLHDGFACLRQQFLLLLETTTVADLTGPFKAQPKETPDQGRRIFT
jgi:Rrf2 family protein